MLLKEEDILMSLTEFQTSLKENNYTIIAGLPTEVYTSYKQGIAPVMSKVKDDKYYFKDAVVVDKVVGKAVAMLLVRSKVKYIYAYVLSRKAKEILDEYNIDYGYEKVVDFIENRDKTGMCPMEQTVYNIDDLEEAFNALALKQSELMKNHH